MKIEVLEERLRSTDPETGEHYNLEEGDRVTVSDACGREWCKHGWAKDLSGDVETGERVVRGVTVQPDNVNAATATEEA